jgi:hypothetical protein
MTTRRVILVVIVIGVIAALVIAFAGRTPSKPTGPNANGTANPPALLPTAEKINAEMGPNDPQIFMLEPEDGSTLDSPFFLRVGVSNFPIPISSAKIHVAIDAACTPAGQTVPKDDAQHVSLPQGVLQNSRFNLPLGQHRLCIQASNQNDLALEGPGMTRVIDVIIQSVFQPNDD